LAATVSSGGLFPNSVTVRGNLLYVLNAGGPSNCGIGPNITGFKVSPDGTMTPLSTQAIDPVGSSPGTPLDCDNTGVPTCGLNPPLFVRSPAQVGFTPDGDSLIVTVKGTNTIYQFPVRGLGKLGPANVWKAQGPTQPTYFGFSFDKEGHLIVTEPFGASTTIPAGGASSVSSFTMRKNSGLSPISLDVPNGQTASCWVAIEPFTKRYAYISNNISSTISVYSIADDGSLTKLAPIAAANHPNDLAVATDSGASFLYVLNSGAGTVGAFAINADGSLTSLGESGGLPADAGAQGLAAY
jgi:hypothetical protein